jgi:pimeloyl-ACP methyl ester carboxylesterase
VRGLVVYLHGTTTRRDEVPSKPTSEGLAVGFVFATRGFAVLAPDYPGLGTSPGVHPYLHARRTAQSVVDAIAATESLLTDNQVEVGGLLLLAGFSQGGHATLATLQLLEEQGRDVERAAAVAGPHNLRTISFPAALAGGSASHSLYLAYIAHGYAHAYGRPLDSVLTPAWSRRVTELLDGEHDGRSIIEALPDDPRDLFTAELLAAADGDGSHWLLEAFGENEVSRFAPRARVLLLYGELDRDVLPEDALATGRYMRARGADVMVESVGSFGHEESMLAAVPLLLEFLEGGAPPP